MSVGTGRVIAEAGGRFAFLIGMPRSGTTLLIERLAQHPDIATTAESHFFREVCRTPSMANKALSPQEARAAYVDLRRRLRLPQSAPEEVERGFAAATSFAAVARTAFADHLASAGKAVLMEKTPDHGFFTETIATVFPQARFVFLVRDPRDVALSWLKVPWNPAGLLWPGIKWAWMVRKVFSYSRSGAPNIVTVRYEDLLCDPDGVLGRIVAFLGLPHKEAASVGGGAATFLPAVESWKQRATQPIDPANTERWRTEMAPAHQFLFDRLLGPLLDRYGYARAGVTLGAAGPTKVAAVLAHECYLLLRRASFVIARRAAR